MSLKIRQKLSQRAKRGDTIIEVMLAAAIFSFVTVITVTIMNSGLTSAEHSLELVTARNELNAQAEALRFIHSSYASELTLPACTTGGTEKCRKFDNLWKTIVNRAINDSDMKIEYPVMNCSEVYDASKEGSIYHDKAFVINTRLLNSSNGNGDAINAVNLSRAYIQAATSGSTAGIFRAPTLNARIIYTRNAAVGDEQSDDQLSNIVDTGHGLTVYDQVKFVEGIWVVAVKSSETGVGGLPSYYDFYIETCWDGAGSNSSTSLDTIIRLYNPDARK